MKKYLLSMGMLLVTATAFAGAQMKDSPDKPWYLYVYGDAQKVDMANDDWQLVSGPYSFTMELRSWQHFDNQWVAGLGGGGSEFDNSLRDYVFYWDQDYNDTQTNGRSGILTWDAIGLGVETGTSTNTTGSIDGINFLTWTFTNALNVGDYIGNEHCNVSYPTNSTINYGVIDGSGDEETDTTHGNYTRKAQTVWHLQTGGKSLAGRQNLWQLTNTINGISWGHIAIGELGTAGSDGKLWTVLPDGQDLDVTPYVAGKDSYTFSVGAQKDNTYIGLTTGTTNANLDTDTPEVCVGQTVILGADWQGGIPPCTSIDGVWWHLPDKYVNQPINYSPNCTTYVKNEDLLTNTAVQCWYVNGDGSVQACSVRETLHFSNGQSVNIAAAGHFAVYRPSVNKPDPNGPFRAALTGFFLTPMLQLANNPMIYTVTINSKYAGSFGLTQLVKMYSQTIVTALPFFGTGYTTWGNFNLDINTDGSGGGEYYDGPKDISDLCKIDDAPGQTLMTVGGSYNGHWKDYVRFTPNGGIPVTLGRIDWNWAATADWYPLGVGWGISSDGADGPALYPDDNFPLWESQGMFKIYIY